jgi:hypothetical protein
LVEAGLFAISSLLPALPSLKIIDVGARSESDAPPYAALLKAPPCSAYGFEPDIEEWEKLNKTKRMASVFCLMPSATLRRRPFMNACSRRPHPFSSRIPRFSPSSSSSRN